MNKIGNIEIKRQLLQAELDQLKTSKARNAMGQFSTPSPLAMDILAYAKNLIPESQRISFLDPAIGTGVFYSALCQVFSENIIERATGYEIDEHYGLPSRNLWSKTPLSVQLADFTRQSPPPEDEKYNLIICNPPYVRHHHINGEKQLLKAEARAAAKMNLSGLAGLYCYFMALSHPWMQENGIAGWLIPSEFMDVNYGQAVKNYLLSEVTLLQIHRFNPHEVQFNDALVSSVVVWIQKKRADKNHKIKFTYGGTLDRPLHEKELSPDVLSQERKWTRYPLSETRAVSNAPKLSDFFSVKRGIATGDNKFFILTRRQIERRKLPIEQFRPILPSPRYLDTIEVKSDRDGFPDMEKQMFVLDCKLPVDEVKRVYPELYQYLEEGILAGVSERYLCKSRRIWYAQESRSESNFYCTYIGRTGKNGHKPFRFILNHSKAVVTNSYLILYPKPFVQKVLNQCPELYQELIKALNRITDKVMLDEGRVYGGGMHKIEPKELANVSAEELSRVIEKSARYVAQICLPF